LFCILFSGCSEQIEEKKVYRVGILCEADNMAGITDGFKNKMLEMGYVEGDNIIYDFNMASFNSSEEQTILKKFVDEQVDLVFAFPTEAAFAAKTATLETGIPVVFAQSMIEENNLVESVQHPGDNITGIRDPGPDVTAKRLEILHELAPQAKRVYINYDLTFPAIPPALQTLRPMASLLGIELVEANCENIEDIKTDLQQRNASEDIGIDAILTMGQPLTVTPAAFALLSEFAAKHNIPIGGVKIPNDNSSVFVYEPQFYEIGQLAAPLADKIFKGTLAGTIPVGTPENHLWLNIKVIQELGLTIPEGLMAQADEIIQ
jgi:putative ABC transport system substrate-binding protein